MSTTSKTSLGLNRWVLTDRPTMAEFNEDNRIIDEQLVNRVRRSDFPIQSGTWTPTLRNSLAGVSFTSNASRFVRQGRLVTLFFRAVFNRGTTSSTLAFSIAGLPFPAMDIFPRWISPVGAFSTSGTTFSNMSLRLDNETSFIIINNANFSNVRYNDIPNNTSAIIMCVAQYETNA